MTSFINYKAEVVNNKIPSCVCHFMNFHMSIYKNDIDEELQKST